MELFAFDSESTGVQPGARLVEVAAVRSLELGGPFLTITHDLCNPGVPMQPEALAANGITPDMLETARSPADAVERFYNLVENEKRPDVVLVAHNAPFDCALIQWEADAAGVEIPADWMVVCTLESSRLRAETPRHGLQVLAEHYGLERFATGTAHRAVADACMVHTYASIVGLHPDARPRPWAEWARQRGFRYSRDLPDGWGMLPDVVQAHGSIEIDYADAKGNTSTRVVRPHGWALHVDGYVSFHGECLLRGGVREFRTDRVIAIRNVSV